MSVSKKDAQKFANSGLCTAEMLKAGLAPHYDGTQSALVPGWTQGEIWNVCRVGLDCLTGVIVPNSPAADLAAFTISNFNITFEDL